MSIVIEAAMASFFSWRASQPPSPKRRTQRIPVTVHAKLPFMVFREIAKAGRRAPMRIERAPKPFVA
jgi:hypothetical protein